MQVRYGPLKEEVETGSRVEEENPTESEHSGRDNPQTRLLKGDMSTTARRKRTSLLSQQLDQSGNIDYFKFSVQ